VRELTVDEFVSLDGFAADGSGDPDFALGYEGPEFARWERQVLDEPQVIVLGRTTYENMSGYFPSATGPIAAAMNAHPKLVFSRTSMNRWAGATPVSQHATRPRRSPPSNSSPAPRCAALAASRWPGR
jgi:dihydrofolate reductase